MQYFLSAHAQRRSQQRGVRSAVVDFIVRHADVELEAGNGCRSLRISKKGRATLIRNGEPVADVERATNVIVVVCEESNEVVTVMHDCNSLGRRYRRQFPTWNSRAA
jgi:hypothetical protein